MNRQAHQSSKSVQRNPVVKYFKSVPRMQVALLVVMMIIVAQRAFALDPRGNKTGTAANVQDAQANPFVPPQPDVEIEGLDIAETGVLAYPDFPITDRSSSVPKDYPIHISKLER